MISADKAIRNECKFCQPRLQMTPEKCYSQVCQLSASVWDGPKSRVKQIRAHCLECAGSVQAVEECKGNILRDNGNGGICWLHPYRFGKNPARKAAPLSDRKKKALEGLRKHQFRARGEVDL